MTREQQTKRRQKISFMISTGWSKKDVAKKLNVTFRTIERSVKEFPNFTYEPSPELERKKHEQN